MLAKDKHAGASSPLQYNPTSHFMTGDTINTSLRYVFVKGKKYHEPQSINWKYNFKNYSYGFPGGLCKIMNKT